MTLIDMENLVTDLQKLVPFKNTIEVGDIVLIAAKTPKMLLYALVQNIVRDETKHDEWWHVTMNLLTLPPRQVTWTLRTPQMTGQEIFTMDGEERFMKAVRFDRQAPQPEKPSPDKDGKKKTPLRRIK